MILYQGNSGFIGLTTAWFVSSCMHYGFWNPAKKIDTEGEITAAPRVQDGSSTVLMKRN